MLSLVFILMISAVSAQAMTPQKYCESLAAVSCEVLNLEISGTNSGSNTSIAVIKYCRNQNFRIQVTAGVTTSAANTYLSVKNGAGGGTNLGDGGGGSYSMTSAQICAIVP